MPCAKLCLHNAHHRCVNKVHQHCHKRLTGRCEVEPCRKRQHIAPLFPLLPPLPFISSGGSVVFADVVVGSDVQLSCTGTCLSIAIATFLMCFARGTRRLSSAVMRRRRSVVGRSSGGRRHERSVAQRAQGRGARMHDSRRSRSDAKCQITPSTVVPTKPSWSPPPACTCNIFPSPAPQVYSILFLPQLQSTVAPISITVYRLQL